MIALYSKDLKKLPSTESLSSNILWIDLLRPNQNEELQIENLCQLDIPTREEMSEIEPSARLYIEDHATYMTASIMSNVDKGTPKLANVTFILSQDRLITVRYDEPKSFELFQSRLAKLPLANMSSELLFAHLMDTIIDRSADISEKIHERIEAASTLIFNDKKSSPKTYRRVMQTISTEGGLVSKLRESLVSLSRMLLFVSANNLSKEARSILKTQIRDCEYLTQHCDSLSNKITFLLDATLGMLSLEQNSIIKIFSVASVALMPPTLIASIYGMNFKETPPFNWENGFYWSLGFMVVSSIAPFFYFKWKKWL